MLIDIIILTAFFAAAILGGTIYQLISPMNKVEHELGAVASGFAGGIVGILIVSFILN